MQLMTWNVNSLKAREAFIADYLNDVQPDIICMQELKLTEDNVPTELFTERGYELAIHGQRQWNGVLIASKKPTTDVVRGLPDVDEGQSRLIACKIDDLNLVNLYCPQGEGEDSPKFQYKLRFYQGLREWIAKTYTPDDKLLIVGDLNVAPLKTDVWDVGVFKNTPSYHPLEHAEWKQLLEWGLEDVVHPFIEPGQFSFWDYRGAYFRENKGMRIDHMLATKKVATWVQDAKIDREARKKRNGMAASDHAPVIATLDPKAKPTARKSSGKSRVILIDGSSLIYRAYYAIPGNLTASSGLHTNAVYGFALMFGKILAGKLPEFGAMIFDAPGGTFRDEEYPDYKAQRPSMPPDLKEQLESIDKLVEQHDFPILRIPRYEADDVIGTLTQQALAAGHEVRIVSGDKDFAQLIGPDVRMIDTLKDVVYDTELVRKRWGVSPEIFIDHLALLGDSVDNIPGVPGIGQKGSASLLERFGNLDGIYENIEQLKGKQKANLIEFKNQAYMSKRLATIDINVPLDVTLDNLKLDEPNTEKINQVYREFEFWSLLSEEETARATDDESFDESICSTVDEFNRFLETHGSQPLAVTPAFEQPSHLTGQLVGVALSTPDDVAYIALGPADGSLGDAGLSALKAYLEDESKPKVVHNLRDVWCLFARHGVEMQGVEGDLHLASFLIDPAKVLPHRLDQIVKEFLHRTVDPIKRITGSGKSEKQLAELELKDVAAWTCHIAIATAEAWPKIKERLLEEGQEQLMADLSMPMGFLLAKMQLAGIRVDSDDLEKMGQEFEERKVEVEQSIYELAGKEFNIGSTKQLATVLFEDLELPVIKKTKTGYSTAADVLERLAPKHEIAKLILRQRALAKLINTYTTVLKNAVFPEDGRVHCTFQQTTGVSGRLITTEPDLQRTPIRSEDGKRIRQAFLPKDGWTLISADWSQIELRVLAHFSNDDRLVAAFREEIDLHRATASELFQVAPDEVSDEQRNMGKTVNFATIYGQGATALGQQLGVPRKEAKAMIDGYFNIYSGVRKWLDETVATAHENGFVRTLLGRKRYIPELSSNNFTDKAYGERVAANTPIQGSAADICKLAMLAIDRRFKAADFEAKMILQIHDELLFEAPPAEVEDVIQVVRECMEKPCELAVPLKVDIGSGNSWAEAH